jgi:hypothetical protein
VPARYRSSTLPRVLTASACRDGCADRRGRGPHGYAHVVRGAAGMVVRWQGARVGQSRGAVSPGLEPRDR